MRIAWFTPFTKKSAIGKYSNIATECIAQQCEVDIWTFHNEDLWETNRTIKIFNKNNPEIINELNQYDLVIYNMGNYIDFHLEIYEVSKMVRGIVILHDFVMHHFFTGYYFVYKNDPSLYINVMKELYGDEAGDLAAQSIQGNHFPPIWETNKVTEYPFIEKLVENALGVITHSHFHRENVAKVFNGPISTINFPFNVEKEYEKSELNNSDYVKLLTVGHVNPNKRVDRVIEAVGQDQLLREKINYTIIGPYENNEYFSGIIDIINKYKLQNKVRFLGYQTEESLFRHMKEADIYVNLRYPTYEGASWSLLEESGNGKPILVTDAGFYSEFPDNTLIKIHQQTEIEDIKLNLRRLIDNKKLRDELGDNTRAYILEHFTNENYRDKFLNLVNQIISQKPMINLINRVSNELFNMGIVDDSKIVNKITDELFVFFK